ncbi:hypothetical protein HBB16_00855 [Pseudonocardia sp. MCCB 268]|nr:hypothetical protein [Pseudonocardia cytotoxica]
MTARVVRGSPGAAWFSTAPNSPELDERRMREVRGGRIGMVFQEPMTAPPTPPTPWASRSPETVLAPAAVPAGRRGGGAVPRWTGSGSYGGAAGSGPRTTSPVACGSAVIATARTRPCAAAGRRADHRPGRDRPGTDLLTLPRRAARRVRAGDGSSVCTTW